MTYKKLILIIAVMVLSGCTSNQPIIREKRADFVEYGYFNFCNKEIVDGVECILCESGSGGLALQCNFKTNE